MTTQVTVYANHGWPVRITPVVPGSDAPAPNMVATRVPANEERTVYVHSAIDFLIHEIQPGESDFEPPVNEGTKGTFEAAKEAGEQNAE